MYFGKIRYGKFHLKFKSYQSKKSTKIVNHIRTMTFCFLPKTHKFLIKIYHVFYDEARNYIVFQREQPSNMIKV